MEIRRRSIAAGRTLLRGTSQAEGTRCATDGIRCATPVIAPSPYPEPVGLIPIQTPYTSNWYARGEAVLPPDGPIELVAILAVRQVVQHVNVSSRDSPFASFTEKRVIAESWATAHRARQHGAIIEVTVRFSFVWYWQVANGRWVYVYVDDADRAWLRTRSFRALLEEFSNPGAMEGIRLRGLFDAEWLLLRGSFSPTILTVHQI